MDSALVLFSNPSDTARIRLDKEHRAIDGVADRFGQHVLAFERRQAASKADLAHCLAASRYSFVQLSGHGSAEGFYVEGKNGESTCLSPSDLCAILKQFQPNLLLLIVMACYSHTSLDQLIDAASYVISIHGPADDEESIAFISNFYEGYCKTRSIESAFGIATFISKERLSAILTRRAEVGSKTKPLVAIFSRKRESPMYLDLSEAEESISRLAVSRELVVSTLSRKMHIHRWIFEEPRDRALLSVGPFFGVFSWRSANDVVICHKLIKVREDASNELISLWAQLLVAYNDLYMSEYRLLEKAVGPGTAGTVRRALIDFKAAQVQFFDELKGSAILTAKESATFATIGATFIANVAKAEMKLDVQEYARAVIFLETALSSMHDFIDNLMLHLTEPH